MNTIISGCPADIPYVAAQYKKLIREGKKVEIIATSASQVNMILKARFVNAIEVKKDSIRLSKLSDMETTNIENMYIFTLGTLELARITLRARERGIRVYYKDCYFDRSKYGLRLISPIKEIWRKKKSEYNASRIRQIKQLIKQLRYDPFKRKIIFSGDTHCWIRTEIIEELHHNEIERLEYRKEIWLPDKSIVFAFSKRNRDNLVPWEKFEDEGYTLYCKQHPREQNHFPYPERIKRIESKYDINAIGISEKSYLVGFATHALASSSRSISLTYIYNKEVGPLVREYVEGAAFKPETMEELMNILRMKRDR